MPKFRVTTQRTQEVVWLIDASSEEDAEEYYGEGEIIEEDYGSFGIYGVEEASPSDECKPRLGPIA